MDQSNIDDAFQLIDRVLGSASIKINGEAITRMDHAALQQALQLLVTAAKDNQENEDNGGTE